MVGVDRTVQGVLWNIGSFNISVALFFTFLYRCGKPRLIISDLFHFFYQQPTANDLFLTANDGAKIRMGKCGLRIFMKKKFWDSWDSWDSSKQRYAKVKSKILYLYIDIYKYKEYFGVYHGLKSNCPNCPTVPKCYVIS